MYPCQGNSGKLFIMAQAKITNHTACEVETLFSNDENFRPLVAPIIKATFDIAENGQLRFAKEQVPVNLEGEYLGDPESSSYIYEPECVFTKLATDVVVIGDAVSNRGPVSHLMVEISVGQLHKRIGVIGDRRWVKQSVGYAISDITPFEVMPLTYENAFGGWDRRHEDPNLQGFEARNTLGKGFYRHDVDHFDLPMPLPNLENPDDLISSIKDRPQPWSCGFTLPHWQPRAKYAGTYDQQWTEQRSPLLPKDFDRRFYSGASEGLVAEGFLVGNEAVVLKNMTANGQLAFYLPSARPPICKINTVDSTEYVKTKLDTIIINAKTMQLQLIWRHFLLLTRDFHEVESVDYHYG